MAKEMHKHRLLLVDDHALFREGVRRFLDSEPDFEVCGSVGTIAEAKELHAVDLVLLDFDLGESDGFEFMHLAEASGFQGKVLLVTGGIDPAKAAHLLAQGISGVFLKHNPPEQLVLAIREILSGNVWFGQDFLQKIFQSNRQERDSARTFTARERQVLSMVFEGLGNKEIADRLTVSEASIKATMQQLFHKTGVRTRSQLVRIALEEYEDQL
jgi:two-component system nitrate/nitrite response regulator NarL